MFQYIQLPSHLDLKEHIVQNHTVQWLQWVCLLKCFQFINPYGYVQIYSTSKLSQSEGTHCSKSHSSMAPVGLSTKMFSSYKAICII